jgi:hypothetical protein
MLTDECGEQFHDDKTDAVVGALLGDPLKPVDTTEPQLQLAATELIDRAGESVGYLALASHGELVLQLLSLDPGPPTVSLQLLPGNEDPGEG